MMRSMLSLVVPLVMLASAAGAQTESLAAASETRVTVRTDRMPVRVADGRSGWVEFDIAGNVGGSASGRMRLSLGDGQAPATMTEYLIMVATLNANESDYEFVMQGSARDYGSRASRQFASRLKLAKTAGAGINPTMFNPKELSVRKVAAGDIWTIDGLTCEWDGKDLICT